MPPRERETPPEVLFYMQRVQTLGAVIAAVASALLASRLGMLPALVLGVGVGGAIGLTGRWLIFRRYLRAQQTRDASDDDQPREG
jgi:hypothetical protein